MKRDGGVGESDRYGETRFRLLGGKSFPFIELVGVQQMSEAKHVVVVYRETREGNICAYYEPYLTPVDAEARVMGVRNLLEIQ